MQPSMRRVVRFAAIGFVVGYLVAHVVFLGDAIATPEFDVLYGGDRPRGIAAWLQLQHKSESVYLVAGVAAAALAGVASLARARQRAAT